MKKSVFEAALLHLRNLPTTILFEICENDNELRSIAASFAKKQVGSPREILILNIITRLFARLSERLFKRVCSRFKSEMLTSHDKVSHLMTLTRRHANLRREDSMIAMCLRGLGFVASSSWEPLSIARVLAVGPFSLFEVLGSCMKARKYATKGALLNPRIQGILGQVLGPCG